MCVAYFRCTHYFRLQFLLHGSQTLLYAIVGLQYSKRICVQDEAKKKEEEEEGDSDDDDRQSEKI